MESHIQSTKQHCKFCFDVLQAHLKKKDLPKYPSQVLPDVQVPIFVTWNYDGQLRGCIGTFEPSKLSKILPRYALISAVQDDRFDPISLKQLPHLSVCVSMLVNFRPNQGAYDWEVGKNGIVLDLKRNGRHYSATFLPEVAQQEGWDKETTLKHLLSKAGYSGPLQLVKDSIKITTYETSKIDLKFKQIKKQQHENQEKKK